MYKILAVLFICYIIISINALNEGKEQVQPYNSAQQYSHPSAHPTNNEQQKTPPEVKKPNTQEIPQNKSSNNNKTQQGNAASTEDNTDKENQRLKMNLKKKNLI